MIRYMNTNFLNSVTNFLKKRTFELVGLLLISSAIVMAIAFITYTPSDPSYLYGNDKLVVHNMFGIYGSIISDFLLQSFGLTSFLLVVSLISWGSSLMINKKIEKILLKIFFVNLYLIFGCTFFYINFNNSFWLIDSGNSGFLGEIIYNYILSHFQNIKNNYLSFVLFFLTFLFFFLATDINLKKIFLKIISLFKKNKEDKQINLYKNLLNKDQEMDNKKPQQSFIFEKKDLKKEIVEKINYRLPSIDLLEKNTEKVNTDQIEKNRPESDFIEKILLDFGINGKIKKINNGPVVSLYEFEPAPGIKVSKIINLSDDLARNTSSTSARVSVIPGKNTVGIEIPNNIRENVLLREIISNTKFQQKEIKLPLALGKSISGMPIIGDLTSMPHLLIAGTTGSGKSVCINTIIVSLLFKLSPDICKFIQ